MKEAAGEANMTVVTIILIGVVAAVAAPLINSVINSSKAGACCSANGGIWKGGTCYASCVGNECSGTVSTECAK